MAEQTQGLLRVREVASRLGLSERGVWGLISSGHLKALRLEGRRSTRVEPAEVEAYIARAKAAG